MIVCVCNNISDRKIRQAVGEGITSMNQLRNELDVGTCCGKCYPYALRVLRDSLADVKEAQPMFFQRNAMAA